MRSKKGVKEEFDQQEKDTSESESKWEELGEPLWSLLTKRSIFC